MSEQREFSKEEKAEVYTDMKAKMREVMAQREEIMAAFAAKYQCEPDDMVQIEERLSPSQAAWYVVHKKHVVFCQKCKDVIAQGIKEKKECEKTMITPKEEGMKENL